MKRVLFVCTGNFTRSQMAEALVNHLRGDQWFAESAGTHRRGRVHPFAIRVLKEIGIEASAARSKSVDEFSTRRLMLLSPCATACGGMSLMVRAGTASPSRVPGPGQGLAR